MKRVAIVLLKVVVVVVLAAPVAVMLTFMAMPLWNALERGGLESVGHSGPAGWCYAATYATITALALLLLFARRARPTHAR